MQNRDLALVYYTVVGCLLMFASAQDKPPVRPPIAYDAVGSWFGRAVPMSPFCEPGSPGCPVPREIVMLPTFFADGNFVGIDSQTFGGGAHTTAHGEWKLTGPETVAANFVFLQSGPGNVFVGGFRMRLHGEMASPNLMIGKINAFFFPFTDETGKVVLDPETGYPVPDPLAPVGDFVDDPADCNPAAGCLSVFEFSIRRVGPE
jgi:hypothetical protein